MAIRLEDLSDEELLSLFKKDVNAFRVVYERYWSRLYVYAFNVLQDNAICEDIIQEIFTNLWQNTNTQQINHLAAYLYQATKFQVFKHLRNGKTSQQHLDAIRAIQKNKDLTHDEVELNYNAQELQQIILQLIQELPDRCRQVFHLSRFEHLSNKEISQKLGISNQTVKNQISKAIKYLKSNLETTSYLIFLLAMVL